MSTQKFTAPDMRQALKMVRDRLGADAVILSNKKVAAGVEIIAAADFDVFMAEHQARERKANHVPPFVDGNGPVKATQQGDPARVVCKTSPTVAISRQGRQQQQKEKVSAPVARQSAAPAGASGAELVAMRNEISQLRSMLSMQLANVTWGDFNHRHPLEANVFKRLTRLGLSPALCRKLTRNLTPETGMKSAWQLSLKELADDLPLMQNDILSHGGIFAFVGPAGVGKTTTIAKLAARYVLEHGAENIALVTTDSYRIAGHEQLSTLGRILKVPVRVVTEQYPLDQILRSLSRKKLVLIDTAGLSHKDQVHSEQMRMLETMNPDIRRWLVLSSTAQRRILDRAVEDYKHLNLEGCIFTKLDESASLGEALSVAIETQLPIAYITDGQNIPDDIAIPQSSRLINHAIALAKEYQSDDNLMADLYSDALSLQESGLAYA